jgi:hypothetical protein
VTLRSRVSIAALVAIVLLATAAAPPPATAPPPKPRVALSTLYQTTDSLWLRGTYSTVNDARGHPVEHYEIALYAATAADTGIVAQASQISNVRVFGIQRPLPGDTVAYWLEVVAVDERNVPSPPGISAPIRIGTPWSPPEAPDVQLDTIPADSLTMQAQGRMTGGSEWTAEQLEAAKLSLIAGDTATICVLTWQGGAPVTKPVEQWSSGQPTSLLLAPDGGNCALIRVLAPTVLLPLGQTGFKLAVSASP